MKERGVDFILSKQVTYDALLIKKKLLSELLKTCKRIKVTHLSYRVDIEDISSMHALQAHGFQIIDTLVTKTYSKVKTNLPQIRSLYKIRSVKNKDLKRLMDIAQRSFSNDRFHLDPVFENKKSDSVFSQWIKDSYRKKYKIFVAVDRHDNAVGFLTYKLNLNLKNTTGLLIMGQGLMAVSRNAKGALISLMKSTFNDVQKQYDYVEYDTRLTNYEVLKICDYFNLEFIRAKYTFHKSLKP